SAPPYTRPDLVVLVEQDVSDPVRLRPLLREDVAHLLVVAREVDVVVGPLVVPGRGPCGRCVELHRTAADDRWPALATQLLGTAPRGVDASSALLAAGTAVGQVLAHLDGRPVATAGTSLVVDPRRPVPRTEQWPVHPDCGCTGLPAAGEPRGRQAAACGGGPGRAWWRRPLRRRTPRRPTRPTARRAQEHRRGTPRGRGRYGTGSWRTRRPPGAQRTRGRGPPTPGRAPP